MMMMEKKRWGVCGNSVCDSLKGFLKLNEPSFIHIS